MKKSTKTYIAYRNKFYAEKKIGNVKNGVRLLTPSQYKRARQEDLADRDILKAQTILHSKAEKKDFWRYYNKVRKTFSRGEKIEQEGTYFGENLEETEGLSYHYNLSGLLKDRDALHFLISFRIDNIGEDRKAVLADYGY